jgi:hypothetical protein
MYYMSDTARISEVIEFDRNLVDVWDSLEGEAAGNTM